MPFGTAQENLARKRDLHHNYFRMWKTLYRYPKQERLDMNNLTALVQDLLSEHGYQCIQEKTGEDILHSRIRLESGRIGFVIETDEDPREITIFLYLPNKIPEANRLQVMEYLTRVNWHVPMGHFEMDLDDGGVRFVVSQLVNDGQLPEEPTLILMRNALDRVETFFPGILRIVHGQLHAVAALTEIEQKHGCQGRHAGTYPSQRLN